MALLLAWNFDEASGAVQDLSGNSRGFTLSGNTVRTSSGAGHTDKGLTQTANDTQVGPAITGLNTTSRTMMAWVKLGGSFTGWALEFHRTTEDTGVWGFLYLSGTFRFRAKNSSNTVFERTITPDAGNWHHLAATHDGTTLKVYRDGVQVGADISMAFPVWAGTTFRVLDQSGTLATIDDVRIYDEVLDAAAITTLMNTPVSSGSAFTGSVSLSGSGTLAGAGEPAVSGAVALSGSGSLAGAGTPDVPGSVALSGTGALSGSGVPAVAGSTGLSGTGTVSGAATPSVLSTLDLAGEGTLLLASGSDFGDTVPLDGSGTLALTGVPAVDGALTLAGGGALVAEGNPAAVGALVLAGAGVFEAEEVPELSEPGQLMATHSGPVLSVSNAPSSRLEASHDV